MNSTHAEVLPLSFILPKASIEELRRRGQAGFIFFAIDVVNNWNMKVVELGNKNFSSSRDQWSSKIQDGEFQYLSEQDKQLIESTLRLECDVFLTVEEELSEKSDQIENELPIEFLSPYKLLKEKLSNREIYKV